MYKGIKTRFKFLVRTKNSKQKRGGKKSLKVKDTTIEMKNSMNGFMV